jgi:hypothetical protein
VPEGGYTVYGVDGIGVDPGGNRSNEDHTLIDHGYPGCPGLNPPKGSDTWLRVGG